MKRLKYIVVDGLVKSGKTELAKILSERLGGRLLLDNTESPFFSDFCNGLNSGDSSSFLKHQLIFLLNRYQQQTEAAQKGLFHKLTISDYIFLRDAIYAHSFLSDEELKLYKKMFEFLSKDSVKPDLAVYLQLSYSEMLKRVREDGTEAEKRIPKEYWRDVFESYNFYFFNYKLCPLLVVNMEKLDLNDEKEVDNLISEILNHKTGTSYYAPA